MTEEQTNGSDPSPESPAPPADAPADGGSEAAAPSTSDEHTMGMLCHLLGIFTWFLGPLIIWVIKKDQSAFVNDQGKEALNFQITIGIAYIAAGVVTCLTLGIASPLGLVVWVVSLIFCIMGTIAANGGERYRYPIAIRLIK